MDSASLAYSRADRERALALLTTFAQAPAFEDDWALGLELFWGGRLEPLPEPEQRRLQDEHALFSFLHWFCFDMPLESEGDTVVSRFLASPIVLTAGERTWLERMAGTSLRLYEVVAVRRDQGLTLKDLWGDATIEVRERLATRQLAQWDLLAVRVIEGEHGALVMEGTPYSFPVADGPTILDEFRRARKAMGRHPAEPTPFFKRAGLLFHHLWLDLVAAAPRPVVVTPEGDAIAIVRVTFDVLDRANVERVLAAQRAFSRNDAGGFTWEEPANHGNRVLGTVTVVRNRCTLETFSEARAARGRKLLEAALGLLVRHRATVIEDPFQAAERAPRRGQTTPSPEVPAEVQQQVVGEYLERHYRSWVDTPLPALDGRTPRKAATLKTQRPRVVALVKSIEGGMRREKQDGRPFVDVAWLWTELGLKPDGP